MNYWAEFFFFLIALFVCERMRLKKSNQSVHILGKCVRFVVCIQLYILNKQYFYSTNALEKAICCWFFLIHNSLNILYLLHNTHWMHRVQIRIVHFSESIFFRSLAFPLAHSPSHSSDSLIPSLACICGMSFGFRQTLPAHVLTHIALWYIQRSTKMYTKTLRAFHELRYIPNGANQMKNRERVVADGAMSRNARPN